MRTARASRDLQAAVAQHFSPLLRRGCKPEKASDLENPPVGRERLALPITFYLGHAAKSTQLLLLLLLLCVPEHHVYVYERKKRSATTTTTQHSQSQPAKLPPAQPTTYRIRALERNIPCNEGLACGSLARRGEGRQAKRGASGKHSKAKANLLFGQELRRANFSPSV